MKPKTNQCESCGRRFAAAGTLCSDCARATAETRRLADSFRPPRRPTRNGTAKRASYKFGVGWIALNDDPGSHDALDVDSVAGYISTALLADLFGLDPERVARDIVKYRERRGI